MLFKRVLLLFLLGFLASCELLKYPVDAKSFNNHQKRNSQMQNWRSHMDVTIIEDKSSFFYHFIWQQQGGITGIHFLLADGSFIFRISGNAQESFLQNKNTKEDEAYKLGDINQAVSEVISMNFPITDLIYWQRGLPNSSALSPTVIQIAKNNKISQIEQNGWKINYQEYQEFNSYFLPTKFSLTLIDNPNLKYLFEIKEWVPNET